MQPCVCSVSEGAWVVIVGVWVLSVSVWVVVRVCGCVMTYLLPQALVSEPLSILIYGHDLHSHTLLSLLMNSQLHSSKKVKI